MKQKKTTISFDFDSIQFHLIDTKDKREILISIPREESQKHPAQAFISLDDFIKVANAFKSFFHTQLFGLYHPPTTLINKAGHYAEVSFDFESVQFYATCKHNETIRISIPHTDEMQTDMTSITFISTNQFCKLADVFQSFFSTKLESPLDTKGFPVCPDPRKFIEITPRTNMPIETMLPKHVPPTYPRWQDNPRMGY